MWKRVSLDKVLMYTVDRGGSECDLFTSDRGGGFFGGTGGERRKAVHLAAPGLNLTSPNSWHAPLLQALSASHALLLQDYGCVEWTSESDRVPAPLVVSTALPFVQPSVGSRNSPPLYLL